MEIVPGVHRIASEYGGRWLYQHVIVVNDRIALIDTGIMETPEKVIFPYLQQIGYAPEQIELVITTHCDADHCGGNETIRRFAPHALFFSQSEEARLLASTERIIAERYGEFQQYQIPQTAENRAGLQERLARGIPMDVSFARELQVRFPLTSEEPGLTLHLLHAAGHTAGHLIVHIPERKVAIIADALLGMGVPNTEGQLALPPTYRYTDEYVNTIEWMKRFEADWFLPTHFHAIRGGEAWQTFCEESMRFVERVEKFILDVLAKKEKVNLPELISAVNEAPLGDWPEAMNQELTYCLLGGLERLERKQKIQRKKTLWSL